MSRLCRLFGISRQCIYQRRSRARARQAELAPVHALVMDIRKRMPRIGGRKLYYLLRPEFQRLGIPLGRDRFFTYLREHRLLVEPLKRYTKTTHSKHWMRKHPNLFALHPPKAPEQVFVSDITYVQSEEGTHYLSLVTDAYSRKVMGYHVSDDMASDQVCKALQMAIGNRRTRRKAIHHSDRGLQYCSGLYQQVLARHGIRASMTEGYDCYQNALAERVNGILKQEFLIYRCQSKKDMQMLVEESIHTYNTQRPHLSLNMQTPECVHKKGLENTPTLVK